MNLRECYSKLNVCVLKKKMGRFSFHFLIPSGNYTELNPRGGAFPPPTGPSYPFTDLEYPDFEYIFSSSVFLVSG